MSNAQNLVDIEFATSQLGGNSELLNRMLGKFCDEFKSAPQAVIEALAQGNMREAKLKIHTTKGLSGNLGLVALYECSKVLDQQIREERVDEKQVAAFKSLMFDTIAYIKTLDLSVVQPDSFSAKASNTDSVKKDAFIKCLERNEFIDDSTLFDYINALPFEDNDKHILKTFVEELQYSKALDMINKVDQ